MKTYYVGMDVHRASIMIVVLNGAGKVVMQSVIETGAERVRGFLKQLRGKVSVTFEEDAGELLHEVVRPLVTEVIVCDPRHNKLLQSGNKNDRVDAQKLAELLRNGSLKAVYHGDHGVRTLKELVRTYDCLVSDTTRVMNRLKANFRGRAIACGGHDIYRQDRREQWLEKLKEPGAKQRAGFLYEQLAALKPLRHKAKLGDDQRSGAANSLSLAHECAQAGGRERGAADRGSRYAAPVSQPAPVLDLCGIGGGHAQHSRPRGSGWCLASQQAAGVDAGFESQP